MSIALEIDAKTEGQIADEARRRGIPPKQMLDIILSRGMALLDDADFIDSGLQARRERAARSARFRQWAAQQTRDTPLLSDEAVSREAIYRRDGETEGG